jgi:hypothetical protein
MRSNLFLLGLAGVLVSISQSSAQSTFSADCAKQDLRLVMSIEEVGEAQSIPSDRIAAAYSALLDARRVCRTGKVAEGLKLYDEVSLKSVEAAAAPK